MRRTIFVAVTVAVTVFVVVIGGLILYPIFQYSQIRRSRDVKAYEDRATDWIDQEQYDKAVSEYTKAIKISLENTETSLLYSWRAYAWTEQGDFDKAISDLTEAIRLSPKSVDNYYNRCVLWKVKGQFDRAIDDITEAINLAPINYRLYKDRTWFWAICPDGRYRDGKRAVADAARACELSEWKDVGSILALAAAHAEAGNFDEAVRWQTKATDMAPDDEKADFRSRLSLYRSGKPYREE